ncbi:MAG: hypothetical protein E6H46_00245 [Betaproteobacteria bacterium]|nr:MAG: hypothetical protein E6H46_00245 [Betaproteobacteria bacterium]
MNSHPYRILVGAGLAMLIGVVGAQTYGDQPAADKNAPQNMQAQPSSAPTPASGGDTPYSTTDKNARQTTASASKPTDKMSGQTNAQAKPSDQGSRKMSSAKTTKSAQHAAKPRSKPEQTAMQDEKAYREALRQCAKAQDQNARDSCLDNAIQQFHRST